MYLPLAFGFFFGTITVDVVELLVLSQGNLYSVWEATVVQMLVTGPVTVDLTGKGLQSCLI